jgi:hypothetical protein
MEDLRHHMGKLNGNTSSSSSNDYSIRFDGLANDNGAIMGASKEARMKMLKDETTKMTSV